MKTDTTRRAALMGAIASVPALASAGAIGPVAAAPQDPIFKLIEWHKRAELAFVAAATRTDTVLACQQGREITAADEEEDRRASAEEAAALEALTTTPPVTGAGARAAIEYLMELDRGGQFEISGEYMPTLLRSPLLA